MGLIESSQEKDDIEINSAILIEYKWIRKKIIEYIRKLQLMLKADFG